MFRALLVLVKSLILTSWSRLWRHFKKKYIYQFSFSINSVFFVVVFQPQKKINPYLQFFAASLTLADSPSSRWSNEAQSPCSNTAAPVGFYHAAPPWRQRYAQLPLCCPETRCHFRNTPAPRPLDRVTAKSRDLGQTRFAPLRLPRINLAWLSVPSNGSSRVVG